MLSAGEVRSANDVESLISIDDDFDVYGCDVDSDVDVGLSPETKSETNGVADAAKDAFCSPRGTMVFQSLVSAFTPRMTLLTGVRDLPLSAASGLCGSDGDDEGGFISTLKHGIDKIDGLLSGAAAFLGGGKERERL